MGFDDPCARFSLNLYEQQME